MRTAINNDLHGICGPMGGFANHFRWLLLMSKEYGVTRSFIEQNVYPVSRSCFNWLEFEWNNRREYDSLMKLDHMIISLIETNAENKIIVLNGDPKTCLKRYAKVNPRLNGKTTDEFLQIIEDCNKVNLFAANTLVIESEDLYTSILDSKIYNDAVQFLNIENRYEDAKEIHARWYDLHVQAEKEAVMAADDYQDFEWTKPTVWPWLSKTVWPLTQSQQEYNDMLKTIKYTYGEQNA